MPHASLLDKIDIIAQYMWDFFLSLIHPTHRAPSIPLTFTDELLADLEYVVRVMADAYQNQCEPFIVHLTTARLADHDYQ